MTNLITGILIIGICTLGYFFSWRYWFKFNYKVAVLLLIGCGFTLRVFTAMDFYLHDWDEKYHAVVAKNLIQQSLKPVLYKDPVLSYDYKNWTQNHIWVHKPPLPLWTMAGSMRIFGVNEFALRLPSVLLSTIAIWLTFVIGSYFINRKAGYLAAFFFSVNGLIIELTGGRITTDHFDIFFLFFITLSIYLTIKYVKSEKLLNNVLAGIALGAAVLSKWLPALIVLPIWLIIVKDSG